MELQVLHKFNRLGPNHILDLNLFMGVKENSPDNSAAFLAISTYIIPESVFLPETSVEASKGSPLLKVEL